MRAGLRALSGLGTGALIITVLSACGNQTLSFNGTDVDDPDKALSAVEEAWKQPLNPEMSTVSAESRCYLQVADEDAVAGNALCGPVFHLGYDGPTWDGVALSSAPSGNNAVALVAASTVARGQSPLQDHSLYRPDGETAPSDVQLDEPTGEVLETGKIVWLDGGLNEAGTVPADSGNFIVTPDGRLAVTSQWAGESIGSGLSKISAPEGATLIAASVKVERPEDDQSLALSTIEEEDGAVPSTTVNAVVGSNSYPVGEDLAAITGGTFALAVEGDLNEARLDLTTDGLTQNLSLTTGQRTSTNASAYYTGASTTEFDRPQPGYAPEFNYQGLGPAGTVQVNLHAVGRSAYLPGYGWAEDGKAWIELNVEEPDVVSFGYRRPDRAALGGIAPRGFRDGQKQATQTYTLTGTDGNQYAAEAQQRDNAVVFQVPVNDLQYTLRAVTTVSADLTKLDADQDREELYPGAPNLLTLDVAMPEVELDFSDQ